MEHRVAEVDHPVVVVIHRMVHRILCNTPTDDNNTGLSVTPKGFYLFLNKLSWSFSSHNMVAITSSYHISLKCDNHQRNWPSPKFRSRDGTPTCCKKAAKSEPPPPNLPIYTMHVFKPFSKDYWSMLDCYINKIHDISIGIRQPTQPLLKCKTSQHLKPGNTKQLCDYTFTEKIFRLRVHFSAESDTP
jgi:hypothetical protein